MKKITSLFILTIAILIVSACAPTNGTLTVTDSWARPAQAGANGAAYFVIENGAATEDALLSTSTDVAEVAEAHMSMVDANGVASMQMQEAVSIPARETVKFKPGGLHIMLINLKQDLKTGDTFTLTLNFKEAGTIVIEVPVQEP
jgi:copper(I)-binding protein